MHEHCIGPKDGNSIVDHPPAFPIPCSLELLRATVTDMDPTLAKLMELLTSLKLSKCLSDLLHGVMVLKTAGAGKSPTLRLSVLLTAGPLC